MKTFTKPLSWNQEVSHIKCLSEKFVNLARASFPQLPASRESDLLLVPHFNTGQIDINLVGPQRVERSQPLGKGGGRWVVGGSFKEKFHSQVSCGWISQASGDRMDGGRADEEELAPIQLNKEDDTRDPALRGC